MINVHFVIGLETETIGYLEDYKYLVSIKECNEDSEGNFKLWTAT